MAYQIDLDKHIKMIYIVVMGITICAVAASYLLGLLMGFGVSTYLYRQLNRRANIPFVSPLSQKSSKSITTTNAKPFDVIVLTPEYEKKVLHKIDAEINEKWIV